MKYDVNILIDTEEYILETYQYVAIHDSEDNAEYLLSKLEETCKSLASFPDKGHIPSELERIGIYDYQEVHFKHYRIIYQVIEKVVIIHCVLDGRRSLQELLKKRLLR